MNKDDIAKIVKNVVDEFKVNVDDKSSFTAPDMSGGFPISVSNRHIHISREHLDILFGMGYQLNNIKDLSQPDQFAAKEQVIIVGPKGSIEKVRILGPERKQTQVEISVTDSFKLGVPVCVRDSGELSETPGITVCGPKGSVYIKEGVIVAKRHIHMTEKDAMKMNLKDKQLVNVEYSGERGGIFRNVLVRVSNSYALDMHIDTDEGNAFQIGKNAYGKIVC